MSMDDLDFIAVQLADPEVMRFYPKCYSREESAVDRTGFSNDTNVTATECGSSRIARRTNRSVRSDC
jgi:hypothetical protein